MDHARISLSLSLSLQNFNTATFRRKLFCPEKRVYSRPQPDFSHLSRHPFSFSLSLSLSLLFRDIFETRIGVSSRTTLSSIFSSKYFLSPRSSNRLRRLADENGRRVSKHRGMEKKFDARREIWSCKYCRHLGPPWKKAKPCGWVETGLVVVVVVISNFHTILGRLFSSRGSTFRHHLLCRDVDVPVEINRIHETRRSPCNDE